MLALFIIRPEKKNSDGCGGVSGKSMLFSHLRVEQNLTLVLFIKSKSSLYDFRCRFLSSVMLYVFDQNLFKSESYEYSNLLYSSICSRWCITLDDFSVELVIPYYLFSCQLRLELIIYGDNKAVPTPVFHERKTHNEVQFWLIFPRNQSSLGLPRWNTELVWNVLILRVTQSKKCWRIPQAYRPL